MQLLSLSSTTALLIFASCSYALEVDLSSTTSISKAAKTIVDHIFSIYDGPKAAGIPGIFPDEDYYWWESGLAWDSLLNYWALTGDDTYNDRISEGLLFQVSSNNDYMPPNQTKSLGNDDQATWALAAMTAAERGFPEPSNSSGVDSWLQLAQRVFDTQVARWDKTSCDGGLRWQIFPFNLGYDYKNTLSNGDFLQLAARLCHYTGNQTYAQWATRASDWTLDVGFIDPKTHAVYDGANANGNCKTINHVEWTASLGTYLSGYVYMYNAVRAHFQVS